MKYYYLIYRIIITSNATIFIKIYVILYLGGKNYYLKQFNYFMIKKNIMKLNHSIKLIQIISNLYYLDIDIA